MSKKIHGVTVGTPMNPERFGGNSQMVVDDALSETSTNPVQNKVVTEALNNKINTLDIARNSDIDKMFK